MKTTTLEEFYVDELKDIYSAEKQLLKALPKISKAMVTPQLIDAVEAHLEQTKGHATRLEEVLKMLGEDTKGPACEAMKGILLEGSSLIEDIEKGSVRDAALIAGCQKVEHYEIASYGTVVRFAMLLGHQDQADILRQTLDEESEADELLSELAEGVVNKQALKSGATSGSDSKAKGKPTENGRASVSAKK